MSENKYEFKGTPAPWFPIEYAGFWQIQDEDAYHSRDVLNYDDAINAAMELKGVSEEKAEANAHLIAAAPELLEACKEALKELEFHNWQGTSTYLQIQQAIHKALNINN